jgi:superfamily II DNA or RNA helicase
MPHAIRLRSWQHAALDRFTSCDGPDFLAVATPGAGKTRFALAAALHDLAVHGRRRVLVVAPTQHLKLQWARAAAAFGLHLDPAWSSRGGGLPADMHGVVLTYQQLAGSAGALARLAEGAFVVFDEVHHAGDDRTWGDAVREAFASAGRRLALSGTPFRSDATPIPFVRYEHGEARPDSEYGYAEALRDGVVRPIYFPRIDGQMEWSAPDGALRSHTFADELDHAAANQRLRTALSLDGEWLPAVLADAHERLSVAREDDPNAGGLVIAMDQEHARGIARLLRERHGVRPVIATSDDPSASAGIAAFTTSAAPWLVTVRMVSEGVDIPRLRVGVFATNTTTELFFRQAVGRLVRRTPGAAQAASLCIPDDPRLRAWSARLGEQRRHALQQRGDGDAAVFEAERAARARESSQQLSLFAALSAVVVGTPEVVAPAATASGPSLAVPEDGVVVTFAPPPALVRPVADGEGAPEVTRHEHKHVLRTANADRARVLAHLTGRTHAEVNAELNRRVGLRSIRDATVTELQRRLEHADRWLRAV